MRFSAQRVDLRESNGNASDLDIDAMLRKEWQPIVDYTQGPLSRFSLIELSPQKHLLLVSLPALCTDAWSLKNLAQELTDLYASSSKNGEGAGDLVQYTAYTSWQNELLEGDDAEAGEAFWSKLDLLSFPSVPLPLERSSGAPSKLASSSHPQLLDRHLLAKCEALAAEIGSSVDLVCLVGWQSLLWRLTGRADIVVGYRTHGREYEELYSAMGPISRCIPAHCHFDQAISFRQQCVEMNEWIEDALEWQEYFRWEPSGQSAGGNEHYPLFH